MLQHYGLNMTFKAYSKYVNVQGEVVDFLMFPPKKGEENHSKYEGLPRGGAAILDFGGRILDIKKGEFKCNTCNSIAGPMNVIFSGEFQIKKKYRSDEIANRHDFAYLRMAIWHEVMEAAGIAIAVEALYWPNELRSNMQEDVDDNFSHMAVMENQDELYDNGLFTPILILNIEEDKSNPAFDALEAVAHKFENEARHDETMITIIIDPKREAEYWEKVEKAWMEAIDAWQDVPLRTHPWKTERMKEAEKRLDEATKRKAEALEKCAPSTRQLPTWEAHPTRNQYEIEIHYKDWPGGLNARVKDPSNRIVHELRTQYRSGILSCQCSPGLYFIVPDSSVGLVYPKALKVIASGQTIGITVTP